MGAGAMTEPVELKTDRLLLRPWRLDDVDDVLAYATDEGWGRFLPVPRPYGRRDAEVFVARSVIASWETDPGFAVVLDSVVIGGMGLRVERFRQTAELGYSIAKQQWGTGICTEGARRVIDWGFETFELAKVVVQVDIKNEASLRVAEKLGATREGVLRSHVAIRGSRVDFAYHGLLREEWEALRTT